MSSVREVAARLLAHPRRTALLVVCAVVVFALAMVASRTEAIAFINSGGDDSLALAVNTKDGTTLAETPLLITIL